MERITISALYADAEQLGGQKVTVAGWVRSVRDMKNFGFVTLNDEGAVAYEGTQETGASSALDSQGWMVPQSQWSVPAAQ